MAIDFIPGEIVSTDFDFIPEEGLKGKGDIDSIISKVENSLGDTKGFLRRVGDVESNLGKHPDTYRPGYHGGVFQVDEIGFESTKDISSHPRLVKKHKKIKDDFGIDWNEVKWEDLRNPLYSAIASRLFISNVPEDIPENVQDQAVYWEKMYNKSGAGSPEDFISRVGKPERELLDTAKHYADVAMKEVGDVAQGLVEGPVAIASGVATFLTGVPVASSELLKGIMAGEPVKGLSAAGEELEKFMDGFQYVPQSRFGKTIAEVGASPFIAAHAYVKDSLEERLFREGLSDKELKLYLEDRLENIRERKEGFLAANSAQVEEKVEAAQFALDSVFFISPILHSKAKGGIKLTVRDKARVRKDLKRVDPKMSPDTTNVVLKALEAEMDIRSKAPGVVTKPVTAEVKLGVRKLADPVKVAKVVEAEGSIKPIAGKVLSAEEQLKAVVRDKVEQPRIAVEGLERLKEKVKAKPEQTPETKAKVVRLEGEIKKARDTANENGKKLRALKDDFVTELVDKSLEGMEKKVAEVKAPDVPVAPVRAPLEFDSPKSAKGAGFELKDKRRFVKQEAAQKVADRKGAGFEVIKIGDKFRVAKFTKHVIPEFKTLGEVTARFDVMSEIPKSQALAEASGVEGLGDVQFGVAKVGDKYYRTATKTEPIVRERKRVVEEVVEDPFDLIEEPTDAQLRVEEAGIKQLVRENKSAVGVEAKGRSVADLSRAFEGWKNRYVDKINTATKKPGVRKSDMALVDDKFKMFETAEEGQAYKEAKGLKGEIITDPLTGKFYIEPDFKSLEDFSFDKGLELLERDSEVVVEGSAEGFVDTGELGYSGIRDLVDIFNNERGAVDVSGLRVAIEKRKDIVRLAKKLGKDLDSFLASIGLSPEQIRSFKLSLEQVPADEQRLKELDPRIEGIINPPKEFIIHQRVRVNSKGGVKKFVPVTSGQFLTVFGARRGIEFKPGKIGDFLKATETRIHAFERYGKKVKELFFDAWLEKFTDSERERKRSIKEVKQLSDQLSNRERRNMGIVAAAEQEGGLAALAADGITNIPVLNEGTRAVLNEMKGRFEDLITRINYVRGAIGLDPIPKRDNYTPFIRQQNALRKAGIMQSITMDPSWQIEGAGKNFNGIFFPFEKRRRKSKIPLELDVFDAYETYLGYALKEIHVAPIAALAKELGGRRIKSRGKKKGVKLYDVNPGLSELLLQWSDEIIGVDSPSTALANKHRAISQTFSTANRNLVAGMIFGNVGTVLKQPTALIGAWSMTDTRSLVGGIARMMGERAVRGGKTRAGRLSNVLEIRRAELILSEFADAIRLGTLRGGKKIASEITATPMNVVDALTAEASWNAAFSHARRKLGLSEVKAARWADDVVVKTQGVGQRGAVSPIQTTTALKWLTMLQTFAIADFNFLARDVIGFKNPDIKKTTQVKRVVKYVVGGALINELFKLAGMDPPKPSPTTAYTEALEEGSSERVAMAKALLEMLEVVPIIGGSAKFGSSLLGPLGELASDLPKALERTVAMLDWDRMSDKEKFKAGMLVGEVLGLSFGVPMTNQIKKSIRTATQGGNWYEVVLGIYKREAQKKGGPPQFRTRPPKPPELR